MARARAFNFRYTVLRGYFTGWFMDLFCVNLHFRRIMPAEGDAYLNTPIRRPLQGVDTTLRSASFAWLRKDGRYDTLYGAICHARTQLTQHNLQVPNHDETPYLPGSGHVSDPCRQLSSITWELNCPSDWFKNRKSAAKNSVLHFFLCHRFIDYLKSEEIRGFGQIMFMSD